MQIIQWFRMSHDIPYANTRVLTIFIKIYKKKGVMEVGMKFSN